MYRSIIPEIHVKSEIHELLANLAEREDVQANPHSNRRTSVVGPHPTVVPNLKPVQRDRFFLENELEDGKV